MRKRSVAEEWIDEPPYDMQQPETDDGAAYIDAATVALTFDSLRLGAAETPAPPGEPATPAALRAAMGCLATGVSVVTTVAEGQDVAMTANSVTSVSLDPPLLLVCIALQSRFHQAITTSGWWGVSILDATAYNISSAFAAPNRPRDGQFTDVRHHRGETGVALLDASVATLQCRTDAVYPGGDHSIIVGEVQTVERRGSASHPLLFHRGTYRWL